MNKAFFFSIILLSAAIFFACSPTLMNLDDSKSTIIHYYESGTYFSELDRIFEKYTSQLSVCNKQDKHTLIFDVDETALNNYFFIKQCGFGYVDSLWDNWLHAAEAPRIEQTFTFYQAAVKKGYRVIFLTGRAERYAGATLNNLRRQGYTEFDTLITRTAENATLSAVDFKSGIRKFLTDKGYLIHFCIGDQESDIEGDFTGTTIKLPNFLYLVH